MDPEEVNAEEVDPEAMQCGTPPGPGTTEHSISKISFRFPGVITSFGEPAQ